MKCNGAYNCNSANNRKGLFLNNRFARTQVPSGTSYALLCDYYEGQSSKQGFIGKLFDGFKNLLYLKSGSKKVLQKLEDYKINPDDKQIEEDAVRAVNKYAKTQIKASSIVRNVFAAMCAGAASFLLKNKLNKNYFKYIISALSGTAGAVALKFIDAKSAKRKYSKNEAINDAVQGGISGSLNCLADSVLLKRLNIKSAVLKKIIKFGFKVTTKTVGISSFANIEALFNTDKNFAGYTKTHNKTDILKDKDDEVEYFDPRTQNTQINNPN